MSDRTEGDTRANAMSFARVSVDPTRVTTDLRDARAAIKQALRTLRETPDESLQFLWLAPFTPKRAWKRMDDAVLADPDRPVFCSNLGDFGSVVCRLDGTDAEYAMARVTAQHETRQWLERTGGQMTAAVLAHPAARFASPSAPTNRAPRTQSPLCVSWLRTRWLSST